MAAITNATSHSTLRLAAAGLGRGSQRVGPEAALEVASKG